MSGRPLRFLGLATGGWIAARIVLMWHETGSLPDALRDTVPEVAAAVPDAAVSATPPPGQAAGAIAVRPAMIAGARMPRQWPVPGAVPPDVVTGDQPEAALATPAGVVTTAAATSASTAAPEPGAVQIATPALAAAPARSRRWSGSGWLIARGGTGIGASPDAPQLGGAQGGVRVDYAVGDGFAATGRIAAPAAGAGRELSLGVAWRPAGVPLRFVAEQRFALDRGRGGPTLGVSGGLYRRLPGGFRLEGYAQGGAIFRGGTEHYLDGIVRAARPLTGVAGLDLDLGAGAWGGTQRGVARLDVGPTLGVRLPIADRAVRLSLDWRQRIAGDARPGSGPALSLGSDF